MTLGLWSRARRLRPSERLKLLLECDQLGLGESLQPDQPGPRALHATKQLIELELDGFRISILGVLHQEDHQKGHDGRSRIDHELPRVRVVLEGAQGRPGTDDGDGARERPRRAQGLRAFAGEAPEELRHPARRRSLAPPHDHGKNARAPPDAVRWFHTQATWQDSSRAVVSGNTRSYKLPEDVYAQVREESSR
jgi:hypothetical protein